MQTPVTGPSASFSFNAAVQGVTYIPRVGAVMTGTAPGYAGSGALSLVYEQDLQGLFNLRGSDYTPLITSRHATYEVRSLQDEVTGVSFPGVNHNGAPCYIPSGWVLVPWFNASNTAECCISVHHPITLEALKVIDIRGRLLLAGYIENDQRISQLVALNAIGYNPIEGFIYLGCGTTIHAVSQDFSSHKRLIWGTSNWGMAQGVCFTELGNMVIAVGDGNTHPAPWDIDSYVEIDLDGGGGSYVANTVNSVAYLGSGHSKGCALVENGLIAAHGDRLQAYFCEIEL